MLRGQALHAQFTRMRRTSVAPDLTPKSKLTVAGLGHIVTVWDAGSTNLTDALACASSMVPFQIPATVTRTPAVTLHFTRSVAW
ncbi:hypothetical protein Cpa01nite_01180 [Cellulomonas pakistanensis]|uniref:Uncharacterized protein n=1 Tax=Cellulomonas pakistanensis TaxID=992287 RepID=A0A919U576_9CELL|nr:hypothetical protein Cpa01nite_01180 [Cellulomonas pakistanensis]